LTGVFHRLALVAQVFNLLYRRLSVGGAFVGACAFGLPSASVMLGGCGLKTRDTADWKVCARVCMVPKRARISGLEALHEPLTIGAVCRSSKVFIGAG